MMVAQAERCMWFVVEGCMAKAQLEESIESEEFRQLAVCMSTF